MSLSVYVLRLRNRRWYVGSTDDLIKQYVEHLSGHGSKWTRLYKPMYLDRVIENASPLDEDKVVKEYMAKYGIDNVRGGSYGTETLDEIQEEALRREIWGADKHAEQSTEEYTVSTDIEENELVYDFDSSESESSDEDSSPINEFVKKYKMHFICVRCGRKGHTDSDCYADRHVDGYDLV